MLVMMNINTPTEEAAPICPLLLANFIYIRILFVWIELNGRASAIRQQEWNIEHLHAAHQ